MPIFILCLHPLLEEVVTLNVMFTLSENVVNLFFDIQIELVNLLATFDSPDNLFVAKASKKSLEKRAKVEQRS